MRGVSKRGHRHRQDALSRELICLLPRERQGSKVFSDSLHDDVEVLDDLSENLEHRLHSRQRVAVIANPFSMALGSSARYTLTCNALAVTHK